ncbi:hypothetical protein SUGI_1161760 [Cryptomeria japonica]|uniref:transcription factor EGL1 n=1 Tax=Cryptomeria japonica TaxID=3369 RepID=UPI002414921A|nr:transcription factor EGL1 [Cryptomeria japonica]GLJ54189.1 hypothetical protein SUGI_1161760 [Cryptomeria japonica]
MDHGWGDGFDQYPNGFLEMEDIQIPCLSNGENILMEPSEMNLPMLNRIHNSAFNPQKGIPDWSEIPFLQSDHGEQMREFTDLDYASHFQASQICNVMQPIESNVAGSLKLRHYNSLSSVLSDSFSGDIYQLNEYAQEQEKGISQCKSYKRKCPQRNPVQRETHILAERQRREEMNEKFSVLRSIIPKLSKKDKASIVTESIKHLLELEKKVKGLQALKTIKEKEGKLSRTKSFSSTARLGGFAGKVESSRLNRSMENKKESNQDIGTFSRHFGERNRDGHSSEIEVQSFGRQAVIKILCPWRSGLVLQAHKVLDNCRVDVLQSTMATSGGKMVYYITIERIEGTQSIDDLMNALEQALCNM